MVQLVGFLLSTARVSIIITECLGGWVEYGPLNVDHGWFVLLDGDSSLVVVAGGLVASRFHVRSRIQVRRPVLFVVLIGRRYGGLEIGRGGEHGFLRVATALVDACAVPARSGSVHTTVSASTHANVVQEVIIVVMKGRFVVVV